MNFFDLFLFVIALLLLSLSYLISLLFNFFLCQKKSTINFNFILVLLENSRWILSATVLDSTDSKCISWFS